jgi:mutator protein MutT
MNNSPKKVTTLCFLLRDGQVLLAMKKVRFGKGKWNGVGGKADPGETPEQATIREAQEEIGVTPLALEKVATLDFSFPDTPEDGFDQIRHVYLVRKWEGEPVETEEMAPGWFGLQDIPYAQMWPDDPYWLPQALSGKQLEGRFSFDADQNILTHEVKLIP